MSIEIINFFRKAGFALVAVAFLLMGNAAFADTPDSLNGATVVDAVKAKSLIDSGVMAIDARVANEYAESHIKGAINIPYKEKSAKAMDFDAKLDSIDLSKFPSNKSTPMVIYCNGPECWKSYKASTAAIKAGYKTVYWFRGGIPEWKAKGYPRE
ncbi:MAG TPA: rhodanese-like domain-containing protein [Gallionella sp.]|nr:rhodanese-like domain-containing protein [Gallionella sp.]